VSGKVRSARLVEEWGARVQAKANLPLSKPWLRSAFDKAACFSCPLV